MLIMTIEWEAGLNTTSYHKGLRSAISDQIMNAQWDYREQIVSIEERTNQVVITFQLMKEEVKRVEQELRKLIGSSIIIAGEPCPIRLYSGSYFNEHTVYDEGDIVKSQYALQIAKRNGIKRNYFMLPEQAEYYERGIKLEAALLEGLRFNQFRLEFQPIYRLSNNSLVGFEALVRWAHPQLGYISPMEFIALAEQSGAIIELGDWIIAESCRQLTRIQHILDNVELYVSINVSPVQLKLGNVIGVVSHHAALNKLDHQQIQFEVTESAMELVDEQIIAAVQQLQQAGFLVAIDDFGTGYACLESVSTIPVSCVKLDKQFIHNIASSKNYCIVVKHMISMLRELDVCVIAEGIETSEQYATFSELGCHFAQGYFMSKPIPTAQLEEERLLELVVCMS